MSINLTAQVLNHAPYKGSKKLVLLAIAILTNDEMGYAFPSLGKLAEVCGVSERFVQRYLHELKAEGVIEVTARPGKNNHYAIRQEWLLDIQGKKRPEDNQHLEKGLSFLTPGSIAYESSKAHTNGVHRNGRTG